MGKDYSEPIDMYEVEQWAKARDGDLVYAYTDTEPTPPDSAFEGYLDDDWEEATQRWYDSLTLADVPEDFIFNKYQEWLEHGNEEWEDRT
jgi:hypothetical protein